MAETLARAADGILHRAVSGSPKVAGVAASATDRERTVYQGAAGVRTIGSDVAMTTDTVCALYSATKPVTGTAALQLVEDGLLDLDAPAKDYMPDLGELQVLTGFDQDGAPTLRLPSRDVTTRMLLLHTAGFGYDFLNEHYRRLVRECGYPNMSSASPAALRTPLLFDPGERWEYGSSIDWVGQVIEAITGTRLGEVLAARVFGPLEMRSTGFTLTPQLRSRLAATHQRDASGALRAMDLAPAHEPEVHMGGQGLYSSVEDYTRFVRMWLNDGAAPDGTAVLRPDTVRMAAQNGLGELTITKMATVSPKVSHDIEFFPGLAKSWALTFMVNDEDAPTGRPAGALGWGGLANVYFWIDRRNGVGGVWATQLFPFMDPTSVGGYLEFEQAVYEALRATDMTGSPPT